MTPAAAAVVVAVLVVVAAGAGGAWRARSHRVLRARARAQDGARVGAPVSGSRAAALLRAPLLALGQRAGPAPGLRVAQLAGELAALLRAGAGPAAAWAQQVVADEAVPTPRPPGRPRLSLQRPAPAAFPSGRSAAAFHDALARAALAAAGGADVAAALTGDRPGAVGTGDPAAEPLRALAAAWRLAERTGAPAADVLDRLATGLRSDAAVADARVAALAAPRATARVLLALPLGGVVLGYAVGVDPVHVLLTTRAGQACAVAGAACVLAAWAWTRALLRAAERAG